MSGNLDARNSPSSAPRALPGRGVRRLNRVPMFAICGLMGIDIFAVIYGFHERIVSEQAKLAASQGNAPQAGSAASGPSRGAVLGVDTLGQREHRAGISARRAAAAAADAPDQPRRTSSTASLDGL